MALGECPLDPGGWGVPCKLGSMSDPLVISSPLMALSRILHRERRGEGADDAGAGLGIELQMVSQPLA